MNRRYYYQRLPDQSFWPRRFPAAITVALLVAAIAIPVEHAAAFDIDADCLPPSDPAVPPLGAAFYVSPLGKDRWSGKLAAPNARGTDGPFATLEKARNAMRASDIVKTTYVRDGMYRLARTLELTDRDDGAAFRNYPGEKPVLSGGEVVSGFTSEGNGVYSAKLASANGLDVFVGGVRQHAAQTGDWNPADPYKSGWLVAEPVNGGSSNQIKFKAGELTSDDIHAGSTIQVFNNGRWGDNLTTVKAVDFANNIITLDSTHWSGAYGTGSTYRVMNDASLIRDTGEFGWRASDGRLVVKPADPAVLQREGLVVARLDTLVHLNGTQKVTLSGLGLENTKWTGPAVVLTGGMDNEIAGNRFENVGTAVMLKRATNNIIAGNVMTHLGNNGVELGEGSDGNTIYANTIQHIGEVTKHVAGVYGYGASNNMIARNEISDSARYGVSLKNFSDGTQFRGNIVARNRILRTNRETADSGAIELLGRSNRNLRTRIEGNHIEDTGGLWLDPATGLWQMRVQTSAVYLDDLANAVTVTGNVSKGAGWAHVFIHGGDDNLVENNVMVLDNEDEEAAHLVRNGNMPAHGEPRNNRLRRNTIIAETPLATAWGLNRAGSTNLIDDNRLYNVAKQDGVDAGSTFLMGRADTILRSELSRALTPFPAPCQVSPRN